MSVSIVRALGGVVRTRTLEDQGVSAHHRAKLVSSGSLVRVGRSWLALPDADAALVRAARDGVVLTCITEAKRRGLWVLADNEAHVAPSGTHPRAKGAHIHWATPAAPRHPDALVDPIENVLVLVASCQPHDAALAVWESALSAGLVSLEAMRRLRLPPAARRLCDGAVPWSGSGLESFIVPRLRWLRIPLVPQVWIARHRVDFLIGDRLVLQIDGGTHVDAQREEDIRHDAELALLGYHVIRVGYRQVVHRWHEVQDLVMRAVAQGLHVAR